MGEKTPMPAILPVANAHDTQNRSLAFQIPRAQHAIYVKDFNVFDVDENGALEEIEITALIKHQTKNASKEQVASLIKDFDQNEDGKIDLEEYITKVVGGEWEITECANGDETKMKKLLAKIKRSDLGELKSFSAPPEGVKDACNALHILLEGKSAEWKDLKKFLGNRGTLKKLKHVPFEPLCENKKKLLKTFIDDPEWTYDKIVRKSGAAASMVALIEYVYKL